MNKPQATETRSRRAVASTVLALTVLASCVIAWTDRRFYINAGYATDIRPSYWPHGLLFAFYAGAAFALARAAIWKTAIVVLAGLSFGIWSMFVVDAALALPGTTVGDSFDQLTGRAGASSLFAGIVAGGLAVAIGFGLLTARPRLGLWIAVLSVLAGIMGAFGWGEAAGAPGSAALLMASSFGWHAGVAYALLGWSQGKELFNPRSLQSRGKFAQ